MSHLPIAGRWWPGMLVVESKNPGLGGHPFLHHHKLSREPPSTSTVTAALRLSGCCTTNIHTCLAHNESESEGEVPQSRLTVCDPVDRSPPGSSVHGILQARILEWVASYSIKALLIELLASRSILIKNIMSEKITKTIKNSNIFTTWEFSRHLKMKVVSKTKWQQ